MHTRGHGVELLSEMVGISASQLLQANSTEQTEDATRSRLDFGIAYLFSSHSKIATQRSEKDGWASCEVVHVRWHI